MLKIMSYLLCVLSVLNDGYAKNFGQYGPVFEIAERNFLQVLFEKLNTSKKNGQMENLNEGLRERVAQRAARPLPTIVSKTTENRTFFFDPS